MYPLRGLSPSPPFVSRRLAELDSRGLRRHPPVVETEDGIRARIDGQPALLFCANDYLGLRMDLRLREAAAAAAMRWGAGSGASRLITGTLPIHRALEEAVAAWLGTEDALVCGSGWAANVALIAGLAGPGDLLLSDTLNHASLIDGCRLSRAQVQLLPHGDPDALSSALANGRSGSATTFLVGESLFSMDGDHAPLSAWITEVGRVRAMGQDTWILLDEAHAIGVLGPAGAGLAAGRGLPAGVLARVGTFGKALGSHGAFIACDRGTRELLQHTGRPYVFSTALPPAAAGAALAAVDLVQGVEGDRRRELLITRVRRLRERLRKGGMLSAGPAEEGPIVPLPLGAPERAVAWSRALLARGFFVQAIRPPTVPLGTSRLRITLSASHDPSMVDALADAMQRVRDELDGP